MTSYRNKRWGIFIVLCFSVIAIIKLINDRIERDMRAITETSRHDPSLKIAADELSSNNQQQKLSARQRKPKYKIVRKDRLSAGRDYIESIFYQNKMEVARQKIVNDKVIESSGEIPQGRVYFVNESKKTYGVEYYRQGEKNGPSRTYFADGRVNVEAYYQEGKWLWQREYYNDGGIRLEVNYEDARENTDDKETGIGRVYYRDGTLKYEWSLTNSEKIGFKKSYNQDGTLRAAFYFDEHGQPVE